jgi:hypothetical protein
VRLIFPIFFFFLQKESVDVSSDADDCMNYESAPISAASDIAENGVFHRNPSRSLILIKSTIFYLEILYCSSLTT